MNILDKYNHKAVAPIIATLLMVAIAVVGGILIFVFTQGFFSEEQVVGPTFDNQEIFGYDARDDGVQTFDGDDIGCDDDSDTNRMTSGDCLSIFVTNKGDKALTIDKVRVFGDTYSQDDDACTDGNTGSFQIFSESGADIAIINPNKDVTVCVVYDDTNTGQVKIGRTIPVQLQTGNGQVSQVNVINGALRGQTSASAAGEEEDEEDDGFTSVSAGGCTITITDETITFDEEQGDIIGVFYSWSWTFTESCTGNVVVTDFQGTSEDDVSAATSIDTGNFELCEDVPTFTFSVEVEDQGATISKTYDEDDVNVC